MIVIEELTLETRSVSGSELRRRIKNNEESWKEHVPNSVQLYLNEHNLLKKIKYST